MAEETKAQAKTGAKGEVAPNAKSPDSLPAVISLESMKEAFPEDGEDAFYAIGIAGGFGDFRRHTGHADPVLELASLTDNPGDPDGKKDRRTQVKAIYAALKK